MKKKRAEGILEHHQDQGSTFGCIHDLSQSNLNSCHKEPKPHCFSKESGSTREKKTLYPVSTTCCFWLSAQFSWSLKPTATPQTVTKQSCQFLPQPLSLHAPTRRAAAFPFNIFLCKQTTIMTGLFALHSIYYEHLYQLISFQFSLFTYSSADL